MWHKSNEVYFSFHCGMETKAKNCGALQSPTNGSLLGNMTTYPHKVKLACNDGFNLRGSRVRQCLSHGNWSGSNTICEGIYLCVNFRAARALFPFR